MLIRGDWLLTNNFVRSMLIYWFLIIYFVNYASILIDCRVL